MRILFASLVLICGLNLIATQKYFDEKFWKAYDDDNDKVQLTDSYDDGDEYQLNDSSEYQKYLPTLYFKDTDETLQPALVAEDDDNGNNAYPENILVINENNIEANDDGKSSKEKNDGYDSNDDISKEFGSKEIDEIIKFLKEFIFDVSEIDMEDLDDENELIGNEEGLTKSKADDIESDLFDSSTAASTTTNEYDDLENEGQDADNNINDKNIKKNNVNDDITYKCNNDQILTLYLAVMNDDQEDTIILSSTGDANNRPLQYHLHFNSLFDPNNNEYQTTNKNPKDDYEIINNKDLDQQQTWDIRPFASDNLVQNSDYNNNEKYRQINKPKEPQTILNNKINDIVIDYIKIRADLTTLTNNLLQKEEALTKDFLRATDDGQGTDIKRFEDDVNAVSSTLDELKENVVGLQNMLPKLYVNNLFKNVLEKKVNYH